MKVIFDTSVLVAGMVEPHPAHERALPWLRRAREGDFEFLVASHTLAELYAVLTTLPVSPRVSPATAWRLIREDAEASATPPLQVRSIHPYVTPESSRRSIYRLWTHT